MSDNFALIGVDGGATKVSAWEVQFDPRQNIFSMGKINAHKSYLNIPGYIKDFKPVDVPTQLQQRDIGSIQPSEDEIQQEAVYVEACALVIKEIAKQSDCDKVVVGIGMPGLKTEDKRGIAVVANGPRMLKYSNLLEERLKLAGLQFASPIYHLGSDADYCGIGENFAANGAFRQVSNAYYLGGGTGVADAMKMNDELVPFDQTKEWMAKSWEMKSEDGRSLERFASAGGIQSIYAEFSRQSIESLNEKQIYPLQISEQAFNGDKDSIHTFELVIEQLSLLVYERISTLDCGWQGIFKFMNENRPVLDATHAHRGKVFEKIIIGQRLGELMKSEHGRKTLFNPFIKRLGELIDTSDVIDSNAKQHYANLCQAL